MKKNKFVLLTNVFLFFFLTCSGMSQITTLPLLMQYGVKPDNTRKLIYSEEIKLINHIPAGLLVLDIEKNLPKGEPMDYTRIRIFAQNGKLVFEKGGLAGVLIRKTKCLPPQMKADNKDKYYLVLNKNGIVELIFVGWPYGALAGDMLMVGYDGTFFEAFKSIREIAWKDLKKDGQEEIVTYDIIEVAWNPDGFDELVYEDAFVYNKSKKSYEQNPELTKIWLEQRCGERRRLFKKYEDETTFLQVIIYLLNQNKKDEAINFWNSNIVKVRFAKGREISVVKKQQMYNALLKFDARKNPPQ